MRPEARLWPGVLMCVSLGTLAGPSTPVDAPDFESNSVTGHIESVYSAENGSNRDVRHIIDHGQGVAREVEFLTTAPEDDLAPRIAIKPNGDTSVVWWRDAGTDQVLYRVRSQANGSWSDEIRISAEGESSRNPEVAFDGSKTWVGYQFDSLTGASVGVVSISDGPEPFPTGRTVLATTALASDLDVRVSFESGRLWVAWIDSPTTVGWSKYDAMTMIWGAPGYELYTPDQQEDARLKIRSKVLADTR